jgi:hypothetical protein
MAPGTSVDDFTGATDRFLAWFKAGGGIFRDDLIEIQDLRAKDAGRGIGRFSKALRMAGRPKIDSTQSQRRTYQRTQRFSLYLEI